MSPQHWKRKIEDKRVKELAESMEEVGNIAPIIVRKVQGNGTYELLAGERRYKALKRLKAQNIECRIVSCGDEQAELLSLQENLMTESPNPKEWKLGVRRMHDIFRKRFEQEQDEQERREKQILKKDPKAILGRPTQNSGAGRPKEPTRKATEKVAEKLNSSVTTINRILRQGKLIETAKLALENKRITEEQATSLAGLPDKKQRAELYKMMHEDVKQTQIRHMTSKLKKGDRTKVDKAAIVLFKQILDDAERLYTRIDSLRDGLSGNTIDSIIPIGRDPLVLLINKADVFLDELETAEG